MKNSHEETMTLTQVTDEQKCYRLACIMATSAEALLAALDFGCAADLADFDEKVRVWEGSL